MSSEQQAPKPRRKDEKIADLERQLVETRAQSDSYLIQLRYAKADLDNLQKQTQKRIEEAIDRNNARIFTQLITLADELDLISINTKNEAVTMIHGKLVRLLEAEGVKPIQAQGKHFDPYKHEAVLEVETEEFQPGTITEEIRSGYNYKDKVLRASMVKVARQPSNKKVE